MNNNSNISDLSRGIMNFEDFFNSYINTSNDQTNEGCEDAPFGFQDVHPELFTITAALLGDAMAGKMPFNIQNAVANWLQLVGQAMATFNAQQQYFEGGPGRCYERKNKNVTNPFCPSPPSDISNINTPKADNSEEIKKLQDSIKDLTNEINNLKKEINKMK